VSGAISSEASALRSFRHSRYCDCRSATRIARSSRTDRSQGPSIRKRIDTATRPAGADPSPRRPKEVGAPRRALKSIAAGQALKRWAEFRSESHQRLRTKHPNQGGIGRSRNTGVTGLAPRWRGAAVCLFLPVSGSATFAIFGDLDSKPGPSVWRQLQSSTRGLFNCRQSAEESRCSSRSAGLHWVARSRSDDFG
jgi:hypothetical protein